MSKGTFAPTGPVQAWQPSSFDRPDSTRRRAPTVEAVDLPTAAEMEAMQERARQEGYESGYREGLTRGQAESQALLAFSDAFHREIMRLDEAVAAEVSTLALAVAQRIIGHSYACDPAMVRRMVEQGLQALPANLESARVMVHPDDLPALQMHLGQEFVGRKLSLSGDPSVSRGGCRILSASTDIDGTLESRWSRVTDVLGSQPWTALQTRALATPAATAATGSQIDNQPRSESGTGSGAKIETEIETGSETGHAWPAQEVTP